MCYICLGRECFEWMYSLLMHNFPANTDAWPDRARGAQGLLKIPPRSNQFKSWISWGWRGHLEAGGKQQLAFEKNTEPCNFQYWCTSRIVDVGLLYFNVLEGKCWSLHHLTRHRHPVHQLLHGKSSMEAWFLPEKLLFLSITCILIIPQLVCDYTKL